MEKIQCSKCRSRAIKNGFQSGKQRCKCTSCNKKPHLKYTYEAYNKYTNSFITSLLKEGCGVRSISRILHISSKTVLSRMLKIAKEIKVPYFNKLGCKFEVDELWTFATGEFAIFDEHSPNNFHGHVRTWNELSQSMQALLRREGVVIKKVKIIQQ